MEKLLYLDNCMFNRPYDNQLFIRIRLETEAKLYIQKQIFNGVYTLIWSFILDYENEYNPYTYRKNEISKWKGIAKQNVKYSDDIVTKAEYLQQFGLKSKDALHIASAIYSKCDCFLTTDDKILNKNKHIEEIEIISPIRFIELEETKYD